MLSQDGCCDGRVPHKAAHIVIRKAEVCQQVQDLIQRIVEWAELIVLHFQHLSGQDALHSMLVQASSLPARPTCPARHDDSPACPQANAHLNDVLFDLGHVQAETLEVEVHVLLH
jgi:hypothetical protein